jgi:hypothetical protein
MGRTGLICWSCKQPVLVKDVAEERTSWPSGIESVRCTTCQDALVQALIAKTRKELGLPSGPVHPSLPLDYT